MNRGLLVTATLTCLALLLPTVMQLRARNPKPCGIQCAEKLCELKGVVPLPLVTDAPNGMLTPADLTGVMRSAQVRASAFDSKSADDLVTLAPCIVLMRSSHFVVLIEMGPQAARIWDPDFAVESLNVSRSKFLSDWTGTGVAIEAIEGRSSSR